MTTNTEPKDILLVDDSREFVQLAQRYLHQYGFNVVGRSDNNVLYQEIVDRRLDWRSYQAVLLDQRMTGQEGLSILRKIVEVSHYPPLPILILTAHKDVELAVRCIREGAWSYVLKSTDWEGIAFAIDCAIASYHRYNEALGAGNLYKKIIEYFPGIVGYIEQLTTLVGDVEILKEFGKYDVNLWPRGHILIGPPGCAKTTIAELTAEALGGRIERVTSVDILDKFVGVSERRARTIVTTAVNHYNATQKPVALIIKQAEMVNPSHGPDYGFMTRVFLEFQDALDDALKVARAPIYFLATSNTDDIKGSFMDRFTPIKFSFPDFRQRGALLRVGIGRLPEDCLEAPLNYEFLATTAAGLTGRKISLDVPQKALTIHLDGRKVSQADIVIILNSLKDGATTDLSPDGVAPHDELAIGDPFGSTHSGEESQPLFPECKFLNSQQQRVLVYAALRLHKSETDTNSINWFRTQKMCSEIRSLKNGILDKFDVRVIVKRKFPFLSTYEIGNKLEYDDFILEIRSESKSFNPENSTFQEQYREEKMKIKQVVLAADLLVGARQTNKHVADYLRDHHIDEIPNNRAVDDRIDLLALELLEILPST